MAYVTINTITTEPISVTDYAIRTHKGGSSLPMVARLLQVLVNKKLIKALELSYIVTGKPDPSLEYTE